MKRHLNFRFISTAMLLFTVFLSGCDKAKMPNFGNVLQRPSSPEMLEYPKSNITSDTDFRDKSIKEYYTLKVALLLPLSGMNPGLGEDLRKAAVMAVHQAGLKELDVMFLDSKGSVEGAKSAIIEAKRRGAHLVLGPLFSFEVTAIKPIAQAHPPINVVSFSTDRFAAGRGVFVMGFMPEQIIDRAIRFAYSKGKRNFAMFLPRTQYGTLVAEQANRTLHSLREDSPISVNYTDLNDPVKIDEAVRSLKAQMGAADALLVPTGYEDLKLVLPYMKDNEINDLSVKFIGSGRWNDPRLSSIPLIRGGWFAAPTVQGQKIFNEKFKNSYGRNPPAIASIVYDAVSLAGSIATKTHGEKKFGKIFSLLTQKNGYDGADGLFRFKPSGLVERGLSIVEITKEGLRPIDPAPTTFD